MIKMNEMKVRLTLLEEALGTSSNNPDIHAEFIASKAPDAKTREEEIAAIGVDAETEKGMTVFARNAEGQPIFWDYQIRGMFKDSCGMLRNVPGSESKKLTNYKKKIDGLIFVKEREIPIHFDGQMGNCQRPLRGQTAQGERISLANSETVPSGSYIEFTIMWYNDDKKLISRDLFAEWLDYGRIRGLGQWRNSGKGIYTWEEITDKASDKTAEKEVKEHAQGESNPVTDKEQHRQDKKCTGTEMI